MFAIENYILNNIDEPNKLEVIKTRILNNISFNHLTDNSLFLDKFVLDFTLDSMNDIAFKNLNIVWNDASVGFRACIALQVRILIDIMLAKDNSECGRDIEELLLTKSLSGIDNYIEEKGGKESVPLPVLMVHKLVLGEVISYMKE